MERLKSRKFWLAVIGSAFVAFAGEFGVDADTAWQLVAIVAPYLLGQSYVDARKAIAG